MGYNEKYHSQLLKYCERFELSNQFDHAATLGYYSQIPKQYFNKITVIDFIKRNGNEVIINLNNEMSEEMLVKYSECFDIIIDGGTLEHIYNVPEAMISLQKMLKPKGLIYHINPHQGYTTHGLYQFSINFYVAFYQTYDYLNLLYDVTNIQHRRFGNAEQVSFIAQKPDGDIEYTKDIIQIEYERLRGKEAPRP